MINKARSFYPVSTGFTLICMALLLSAHFFPQDVGAFFSAPTKQHTAFAFDWKRAVDYLRLFIHVLGHKDWAHFIANAAFILLLGPACEDRYGSGALLFMISCTAFITGILSAVLSNVPVCGSDGIVFLLLLLAAFAHTDVQGLVFTQVLLFVLYLASRLFTVIDTASAVPLIHIAGGLCASLFAFTAVSPSKRRRKK